MYKTKLNRIRNLIEEIKNDINLSIISDFLEWFYEKLDLNFNWTTPKLKFKKWELYFVNLWKNIWSELNKTRPCIIYSKKSFNNVNSVIIIPLKSNKWKNLINKFHIEIFKSSENKLQKYSICDIFHIKNISTKRLKWKIWILEDKYLNEIDKKVSLMFDIKTKDET